MKSAATNNTTSSTRKWLVRYPRAVSVGIFLLVAAITAMSVFAVERGEQDNERIEMISLSETIASSLALNIATNTSYLRAGAALFGSNETISRQTFGRFIDELRVNAGYSGAEGIGWAPMIRPAQLPEFEEALVQSNAATTSVYPRLDERSRDRLVPIKYLQPNTARNRRAIGFDMYSEPVRREAIQEATRRVEPTASGRVVLVQEGGGDEPGFLTYMPVFANNNYRDVKGYVYSPFNARDFLRASLETEELQRDGMGIYLYDTSVAEENLLARIAPQTETGEYYTREIEIANHPFVLVVESTRGSALSYLSLLTLFFGLAVASLLMLVARLMTKQAMEDEKTLNWLHEQNSIRNSLTRELNHRVKNTLANVLSIIALTRRRADNLDEFADSLDGRIRALSATHDLLTQSDWNTTPVEAVVDAELAPYAQTSENMIDRSGPDVELAPNDALSLGMALHELATNAAKYGALSKQTGRVRITWELIEEGLARLDWVETGGPPVSDTRERGFGTDLIEKIVAHELRNPVDLVFDPTGVRCSLLVPVRNRGAFQLRAERARKGEGRLKGKTPQT
ncbi:CHASE domain-containing protein [Parapontixanthobacter aurantiacus]